MTAQSQDDRGEKNDNRHKTHECCCLDAEGKFKATIEKTAVPTMVPANQPA